jgi:RimJ/RimL family protein N-acetyltransferase
MLLSELSWPRHTERLSLRPARVEDVAALWAWQSAPGFTHWMPRLNDDLEKFAAHLTRVLDKTLVGSIGDQLVVSAKIDVHDPWSQDETAAASAGTVAEIGWAVDLTWQGRGLGTELAAELLAICFDGLGLHRVVAECFADNAASAAIMERVGMRREAHYRANSLHRDGTWRDSFTYALLEQEWFARRALTSAD